MSRMRSSDVIYQKCGVCGIEAGFYTDDWYLILTTRKDGICNHRWIDTSEVEMVTSEMCFLGYHHKCASIACQCPCGVNHIPPVPDDTERCKFCGDSNEVAKGVCSDCAPYEHGNDTKIASLWKKGRK